MRVDEGYDARDPRDGGFSFVQHELYAFFLPIVGREAAWLYDVMAWLIPKREREPIFDLTIRVIAKNSGLSVGATQTHLNVLLRTGMLERRIGPRDLRPTFLLADLRILSKLGETEIRKRLNSVHQVNRGDEGGGSNPPPTAGGSGSQSRAGGGDTQSGEGNDAQPEAASPAASGESGVHQVNAAAENEAVDKNLWKTQEGKDLLFTKGGGLVQKTGGFCSPGERPLIKEIETETRLKPLTQPAAASGVLPSIAASAGSLAELVLGRAAEELPDERQDRQAFHDAVAKVMRECTLAGGRYATVIERAMRAEAAKTDERPDWNAIAERMVAARTEYSKYSRHGLLRYGPYGVDRFFLEGIWRDEALWAIDEEKCQRRRVSMLGSGRNLFGESMRREPEADSLRE